MTLDQMASLKRWHVNHRHTGWLELQVWDGMLTLWVMGWAGLPLAWLLAPDVGPWACLAGMTAPHAYVALRAHLHRRGRLRCDWLSAITL